MNFTSISDLARADWTQRQAQILKSHQVRLTQEIATGTASNLGERLGSDISVLSSLIRNQTMNEQYIINGSEQAQIATSMQLSMDVIAESQDDLLKVIDTALQTNLANSASLARVQAKNSLGATFSALNSKFAGQFIFSGVSSQQAPLADLHSFLNTIDTLIPTGSDVTTIQTTVEGYFQASGDFFNTTYLGSRQDLPSVPIAEDETISLRVRADDDAFLNSIKSSVYAYLAGDESLAFSLGDQKALLDLSKAAVHSAKSELIDTQANLGFSEQRIQNISARISVQNIEIKKIQNDMTAVDTFETASQLEDINNRMELLYAATVRVSNLSFLDFMR